MSDTDPNDPFHRRPLTRSEFDDRCARLEELRPELSQTSGRRSPERNAAVGGNPKSKHILGLAKDYVPNGTRDQWDEEGCLRAAWFLGLWGLFHGAGRKRHLHVQGVPVGWEPKE